MFCDYNEEMISKYMTGEHMHGEYMSGEYMQGEYMQGEYMQGEYMQGEYNNTTILSFLSSFFIIGCSIISGLSIGTFIVAQFMYPSWQKINSAYEINCEDEEDEDEEDYELEDDEDEEDYTQKYMEEFKALPSRSLSLDEIKDLKTKTVEEFVKIEGIKAGADNADSAAEDAANAAGANSAEEKDDCEDGAVEENLDLKKIIMTYNNETESFWYYTDYSTKILYPILDMVARKFVITYDCKDLYVSLAPTDILTSALVATVEEVKSVAPADAPSAPAPSAPAPAPAPAVVKSIFAKFKMYNSEPVVITKNNTTPTPTTPTPHIIKKTNQFKYKGKLKDFSPIKITTADLVDTETKIDYASFKKQYNLNKI